MEVLRSKIHSINESVCPGAGHLSSFFFPGAGYCHAFPARPSGVARISGQGGPKKRGAQKKGDLKLFSKIFFPERIFSDDQIWRSITAKNQFCNSTFNMGNQHLILPIIFHTVFDNFLPHKHLETFLHTTMNLVTKI